MCIGDAKSLPLSEKLPFGSLKTCFVSLRTYKWAWMGTLYTSKIKLFSLRKTKQPSSPHPLAFNSPLHPAGVIFFLVVSCLFSFFFFKRQKAKPWRIFQLNVRRQWWILAHIPYPSDSSHYYQNFYSYKLFSMTQALLQVRSKIFSGVICSCHCFF